MDEKKKSDFGELKIEVLSSTDDSNKIEEFSNEIKKICTIKAQDLYNWPIIKTNANVLTTQADETKLEMAAKKDISKMNEAKTQKAKGVMDGLCHLYKGNDFYSLRALTSRPPHKLITNEEQIEKNGKIPCFARPCPIKPRHGFIDSRVITSNKELLELWKEVKAQDKNGEIILGPHYSIVRYNAVYASSGSLSIGVGNDGATAGKDSISFPVAPTEFNTIFLKDSGLTREQTVYLESIHSHGPYIRDWNLVQARGGPAISAISPDYVPESVTVKDIVVPHNDLLRWETEVKKFKTGTVVYGAEHTLASHAAIHCVLNKIPFVTSRKPKVDDILLPQGNEDTKINRVRFKKGVRAGLQMCRKYSRGDMKPLFYYSISILHNWAYIKHSNNADWLLGAASVLFAKISMSLCCGEHRHLKRNGVDLSSRSDMYKKIMKGSVVDFYRLPQIFEDFHSGKWTSGFGGIAWATCAWYTHALWKNIVLTFNRKSSSLSDKEISNTITIINKTTNIAHNNGWWFNKIACKLDLESIALNPGVAAFCVADIFFKLNKRVQSIKSVRQNLRKTNAITHAPCAIDNKGRLSWLYMYGVPSKRTEFTLLLEDGKTETKCLNLSKNEITGLKYKREKVGYYPKLLVPVISNGKFRIPGGKERYLGKVFKTV